MTKEREPLSVDAALARIMGQLPGGYEKASDITGRTVRTVRDWGDPDKSMSVPLDCAIALDLAYQEAGGEGHPLHDAYTDKLEEAERERFACRFTILRRTVTLAQEAGDAQAALARLCLPDSTDADRRAARRELAEAYEIIRQLLSLLETPLDEVGAGLALQSHSAAQSRAPP